MTPHADPPAEAESDVAFVLGIRGRCLEVARHGVEMPSWVEEMGIGTEGAWVSVDSPDIGNEKRALGN